MRYGVVVRRWFGMDGWWTDMDGLVVNVLKIGYYYYITNVTSHALRMQTTAKY